MSSTTTPAGRQDYLQRLAAVREHPRVKGLAQARAGDPELAHDALQETYDLMARIRDPGRIVELRAYFCRVLIRVINAQRGQLGAYLPDDIQALDDSGHCQACGHAPPRPLEETVAVDLLTRGWLESFSAERAALAARVAGRSPDPGRYRNLIVTVAEQVLRSIAAADVCDADGNPALRAAYPQWFAAGGGTDDNAHQRFARARKDVRALLRTIVNHDDLLP